MVIAMFFLLKSMLPFLEGGKSLSLDSMRLSKKTQNVTRGREGSEIVQNISPYFFNGPMDQGKYFLRN